MKRRRRYPALAGPNNQPLHARWHSAFSVVDSPEWKKALEEILYWELVRVGFSSEEADRLSEGR